MYNKLSLAHFNELAMPSIAPALAELGPAQPQLVSKYEGIDCFIDIAYF